jgi:ATP-binding protein involved in chromosome partitioning
MVKIKETISELIQKGFKLTIDDVIERNGVIYVMIKTSENNNDKLATEIENAILKQLGQKTKVCFIQQSNQEQKKQEKTQKLKKRIQGVKKVILICSGKGGVGKSTISSNIAYHMALAGYKVGLFDSDIYGPSIQKIFGIDDEIKIKDGTFIPHEKFKVKLMSMGFIVQTGDALVWRGPMVSKTLHNMLMHTDWSHKNLLGIKSDLDYLIIDSPPGTGDVHLSLSENYIIDGAVVVSTPQEVALSNAHRSVDMLKKLDVKILGIIENMAYINNPDGSKNYIFGSGNIEKYAIENGLRMLATIPIIPEISSSIDLDKIDYGKATSGKFKELCDVLRRLIT